MNSQSTVGHSLSLLQWKAQSNDAFSFEKLQDQVSFTFLGEEESRLPKKSLTKPLPDYNFREHLEVELSDGNLSARCPKAPKL